MTFNGTPADVRRACAELGLDIVTLQPFRDFEGMPPGLRERAMDPRRAQVRRHAGARLRSPDDLQQRLARIAGRHRPRRRRPARAGRARRQARHAHRLRGAGLGPAHQRLPRLLGGGAARRPSRRRPGARHLPHPGARHRSQRHPRHPRRPHLPGAARRRAAAADGLPLVEPALPQFPRPGRAAGRSTSWKRWRRPATTARCRWRSSTTSSAPARRAASRSTAIARCASCSTSSPSGPASGRPACRPAAALAGQGRGLHRVLRRR